MYDRKFKRDAYLALGVREVWLVDLRDRSIEVCTQPGAGRLVRDAVTWTMPGGDVSVHVELAELFGGIAQRTGVPYQFLDANDETMKSDNPTRHNRLYRGLSGSRSMRSGRIRARAAPSDSSAAYRSA